MKSRRLLLFVLITGALFADSDEHKQRPITLSGTIVDTGCYMAHDSEGPEHASCAAECAKKGVPLAFADESGKLYFIVAADHKDPNAILMPYIEKKVKVIGTFFEKGGAAGISVRTITPVP